MARPKRIDPMNDRQFTGPEVVALVARLDENPLLSTADAAEELGVDVSDVQRWADEGVLPHTVVEGVRVFALRALWRALALENDRAELARLRRRYGPLEPEKANGRAKAGRGS